MQEIRLNVNKRNLINKQETKRIRREGKVPAIFYHHGEDSVSLTVDKKEFLKLMSSEVNVVNLLFEDNIERQCVIREIQFDPVTSSPIHIDFLGIKKGEKVHLEVPLHLTGTPKGVKDEGGILQHSIREISIECLPQHIPEHLEIDITSLEIGQSLHFGDLHFENLTILNDPENVIASVVAPRIAKEQEVTEEFELGQEETTEPEVIRKSSAEEEE